MKKINILWIGLIVLSLTSCKKFLDVKPTNSIESDNAIQTPSEAQVMINGLMRYMTNSDYYGRNFMLYGDAKGGDYLVFSAGRGQDGLYTFNHAAASGSYSGYWAQLYFNILQANNLLSNIQKLEAAGKTGFNSYKGQALTARALMYFDLVRIYGKNYNDDKSSFGVPNILEPLSFGAQPLRATVADNYTQILKDLKTAEPLLNKTVDKGYINYYANMAIQARVYLYMNDMPNALIAAEKVINASNLYKLYTPDNWLESWKNTFGTESIFELGIVANEGDLGTGSLGIYTRRKGHGGSSVLGYFLLSDYYLNRLKEDPTDVRWGVIDTDESSTAAKPRKGSLYKYSGSITLSGDKNTNNSTAVNIKVIRLSEIYLIAAEAALGTDKGKAATYLNEIRKRARGLAPATAANVSIDMILDERSKELVGEGHRFFDMMRLNRTIEYNDDFAPITVSHRPKTIDRTFYKTRLPISQGELNANPGLKPQQNQGY